MPLHPIGLALPTDAEMAEKAKEAAKTSSDVRRQMVERPAVPVRSRPIDVLLVVGSAIIGIALAVVASALWGDDLIHWFQTVGR